MKLGLRLLLAFFLITGIAAFFVLRVFVNEVRPSVSEVMEDLMVDTANILAELARDELARMPAAGTLQDSEFAHRVRDYANRPVDARIWGLTKRSLDYRIYVTDRTGRVVFDSGFRTQGDATGADYSHWRDVALTLRGDYGARATREIATDERSSVMYVAAPVRQNAEVIGVLTVAKPMSTVHPFVDRAERQILARGAWLLGLSLLIGVLVTGWLVWSVRRLRLYAQQVELGQRLPAPQLSGELGELAQAMETMQERLQGREHIENVVRALTHELKSPLTAISGAAELLQEDLPVADRRAFAGQIVEQSTRMRQLIERLLELSKLEHRHRLDHMTPVDAAALLESCTARAFPHAAQRGVTLELAANGEVLLHVEPELLGLAIGNLLDNAIDFSPSGGHVWLKAQADGDHVTISVRDEGPGVADFAMSRLGERFFSTPRPAPTGGQSQRKGSGLGIAIVRQVAALHGGTVDFDNTHPGLRACLRLPRQPR